MHVPDFLESEEVARVLRTPPEERDAAWRAYFFEHLPNAALTAGVPQLVQDPDGFPYVHMRIPTGSHAEGLYTVRYLTDACLEKGWGIALFGVKSSKADYMLSYGDLSSFKFYESFQGDPKDGLARISGERMDQLVVKAPSDEFLPLPARRALGQFIRRATHLTNPGVAMVIDPTLKPPRNLMFNVFPEHVDSPGAFGRLMRGLAWFLPKTRGLMQGNPSVVRPENYQPLPAH